MQVTDEELHKIITLRLGCQQIKWTDKKRELVLSPVPAFQQPGSSNQKMNKHLNNVT